MQVGKVDFAWTATSVRTLGTIPAETLPERAQYTGTQAANWRLHTERGKYLNIDIDGLTWIW
jgi:hypothetical protein